MRLLGLGILVQIVACAVVGTRLVLLSRRTRKVPELAYGCTFLLLGVIGFPVSIPARTGMVEGAAAGVMLALGLAAQNAAALSMGVATWKTFRPEQRWLLWLLVGATVLFVVSLAGQHFEVGYVDGHDGGAFYWLGLALRFAAFAWTCAESFRYHAALRRRRALGLADAVVTDRIRLWALSSLATCVGFAVFVGGRLLTENALESPIVLTVTSIVGLWSASAMTLAFFPPASYLRRVRAAGASG